MRQDLFLNEKVEIYEFKKEKDGIYIRKRKNIDFDQSVEFKEKVKTFFVNSYFKAKLDAMKLTQAEKDLLEKDSKECDFIRMGYDVRGIFENGIEFNYPSIIKVSAYVYQKTVQQTFI